MVSSRSEQGSGAAQADGLRGATLEVVDGPEVGKRLGVGCTPVVIGSDPTCDLCIADDAVSRRHFEVAPTASGLLLTDLGSTNGTWVEGIRVVSCFLDDGFRIAAGHACIRIVPARQGEDLRLSPRQRFGALLGAAPAMRRVFAVLERIAPTDATVLIEGESGTGKELAARSIHDASPRAGGPFVVVDCGAMATSLIESELFGHERGAFTGADHGRVGAFEAANGGTVMLDEVGELPLAMQPKLLRVLDCRQMKRVGGDAAEPIDVRVVAATNRDLEAEVRAGRFREDLYYRLAVVRVELPPLRERRDDVALLAREFAVRVAGSIPPGQLGPDLLAMLARHDWPGNVRELRNVVERLLLMPELGAAALLGPTADGRADTEAEVDGVIDRPYHEARALWAERFERAYLEARLEAAGGVVLRAAESAGIPRQTFHRLMRKHGLRTGTTPTPPPQSAPDQDLG